MKTKKILVVEDSVFTGFHIQSVLHQRGFEYVKVCHSGEEALDHYRQFMPNVVLLDIDLKGQMNGIDVARTIRTESSTPILFISGRADGNNLVNVAGLDAGFLSKPFSDQILLDLVTEALQLKTGT